MEKTPCPPAGLCYHLGARRNLHGDGPLGAETKTLDFVCIGSATQDVFVRSEASKILTLSTPREQRRLLCFEYGAKITVEHIEFTTGGGATNTAVSLARLGARAAFIGKIGRDPVGRLVLDELTAHGVDVSMHRVSDAQPTGYSVILTSYTGDRTVLTHRGASTQLHPDEVDWNFLDRTAWLYVTSLAGDSAELLGPIAEKAPRAGVRIAFNPGSTQLRAGLDALHDLLAATEILLLNKEEASLLTGKPPIKDVIIEERCTQCGDCIDVCPADVFVRYRGHVIATGVDRCVRCGRCLPACPQNAIVMEPWTFNVAEAFEVLGRTGPKVVVVTDGPRGVQAYDGKAVYLLPAQQVSVASSLGAGDAFGSAFAFEYARSGDIARALALGVANAGSVVQVVGAKNGLLDAAGAEAALAQFDPATLRRYDLGKMLTAVRPAAESR